MQPTLIRDILDSQGNVIKAFEPVVKWDVTKDPVIDVLDESKKPTGEKKVIEPWVIEYAQEGMRQVVVYGTAKKAMALLDIPSAGKTGTAEYCDDVAQEKGLCQRETWPFHAWYAGYAPYDDPEIVVVAFVYNGGEGASVAAPIVKRVLDAYFEMKAMDTANQQGGQ
jgi:penicillin-binding protein 2